MDEKIRLFNNDLDIISARDCMEEIQKFLIDGALHTIKLLDVDIVYDAYKNSDYRNYLELYDRLLIEDLELFQSLNIDNKKRFQEIQRHMFRDSFMRFLITMKTRVILLFDDNKIMRCTKEIFAKRYKNINLLGVEMLNQNSEDQDELLNHINGQETQVIMSLCNTEMDELFLKSYEKMLSASIWISFSPTYWYNNNRTFIEGFKYYSKKKALKRLVSR